MNGKVTNFTHPVETVDDASQAYFNPSVPKQSKFLKGKRKEKPGFRGSWGSLNLTPASPLPNTQTREPGCPWGRPSGPGSPFAGGLHGGPGSGLGADAHTADFLSAPGRGRVCSAPGPARRPHGRLRPGRGPRTARPPPLAPAQPGRRRPPGRASPTLTGRPCRTAAQTLAAVAAVPGCSPLSRRRSAPHTPVQPAASSPLCPAGPPPFPSPVFLLLLLLQLLGLLSRCGSSPPRPALPRPPGRGPGPVASRAETRTPSPKETLTPSSAGTRTPPTDTPPPPRKGSDRESGPEECGLSASP